MEGFRGVSAQGNDEESDNFQNVRIWMEVSILEYKTRCIAKIRGNLRLRNNTQGGALMMIQRKILCWKQFEGDMRGEGEVQRRVLIFWLKAEERRESRGYGTYFW